MATTELPYLHPPLPCNYSIVFTFFRSGMAEGWARGYEKVTEACEKAGAKLPIVEVDYGGLMMRIDESEKYKDLRLANVVLPHSNGAGETVNANVMRL